MVKIDNRLPDDEDGISASGFDAAIDALATGLGKASTDSHPEKRGKALYKAFCDARLPSLKDEQPGLRHTQYQERLFEEWKVHPDNPKNQKATRFESDGSPKLGYDPSPDDEIETERYDL